MSDVLATDAEATLQKFLTLFNAGTSVDDIVELFAPNVQFWGTTLPEYGTGSGIVKNYFASAFARRGGMTVMATVTNSAMLSLSDDVATTLGRWEIERGGNTVRLRFSMVFHKQNGRWLIVQFHSSPRPSS